jgi:hypothetical protein
MKFDKPLQEVWEFWRQSNGDVYAITMTNRASEFGLNTEGEFIASASGTTAGDAYLNYCNQALGQPEELRITSQRIFGSHSMYKIWAVDITSEQRANEARNAKAMCNTLRSAPRVEVNKRANAVSGAGKEYAVTLREGDLALIHHLLESAAKTMSDDPCDRVRIVKDVKNSGW